MTDQEAIRKAMSKWPLGYAFLPKSGWRQVEGGFFYRAEDQFGQVFGETVETPKVSRHKNYMYEVGFFTTKNKAIVFRVVGRGMTWEEAFQEAFQDADGTNG